MRQLTAFTKKEFMESTRTGRMPLLVILSVLFGIMNPLVAKLMPWMMEAFAGSLEESEARPPIQTRRRERWPARNPWCL